MEGISLFRSPYKRFSISQQASQRLCDLSGINFAEYWTSCTKDLTSVTSCGGLAFTTATIFPSLGAMPRALSLCPKSVSLRSLNWYLSPLTVSSFSLIVRVLELVVDSNRVSRDQSHNQSNHSRYLQLHCIPLRRQKLLSDISLAQRSFETLMAGTFTILCGLGRF